MGLKMYSNSKIYKITDIGYNECYYGSTIQPLSKRMSQHKCDYITYKDGKPNLSVFYLFNKYGLENCKIELVENYECKTKDELHQREGYFIKNNECVNKLIPGRTPEKYREEMREQIREKDKLFYKNNKEKRLLKMKEYSEKHKEELSLKKKEYRENHKEELSLKIKCECGGHYIKQHKTTHFKTKKHINYLENK